MEIPPSYGHSALLHLLLLHSSSSASFRGGVAEAAAITKPSSTQGESPYFLLLLLLLRLPTHLLLSSLQLDSFLNPPLCDLWAPSLLPLMLAGFGKILALDEFFSGPSETPLPNHDGLQETIVYHLSEAMASNLGDAEEEATLSQPHHGLQLYYKSTLQLPVCYGSQTTRVPDHALVSHLKDASSVPAVLLEDADGGARVKVIVGIFGGLASSLPQDQSLMLDVQMRPGSHVDFPLESSFSNLVYVVEGVGIFHAPQLMPNGRPSYQNEGHGFIISPTTGCKDICKFLRVSTHPCSHLRFILLGAAPLLD